MKTAMTADELIGIDVLKSSIDLEENEKFNLGMLHLVKIRKV